MASFRFLLATLFVTVLLVSRPAVPRAQCGGCESRGGIEPGAWALQFRVTDNFTLSDFGGSIVSAKYHFSESRAIRFGVSGSLGSADGDASVRETIGDSLAFDGAESDKTRKRSVGLSAEYLHYFSPRGRMNAFIGAGPLFSYSWNSEYRHTVNYGDVDAHGHGWEIGASGLFGVEWFAAKSISFQAEYGLALTRSWGKREDTRTSYNPERISRSKTSDHRWNLGGSSVQLGLSAYL